MMHLKKIDVFTASDRNLRAEDGFHPNLFRKFLQEVIFTLAFLLAFFLLALLAGHSAWGQTSGRITGTVKDLTGAVIPQSTITATNIATGVKQSVVSDGAGVYTFPVMNIGTYTVEVDASGFKSEKQEGIKINVNTSLTIDFTLHVPKAAETVTVDAGGARVETTDTQIGQTIESKQVTNIPLNGRSYTDLLAVQAGVSPITTSGAANSTSGGGFGTVPVAGEQNTGQFSIHGQRESDNAYYLNGVSVQETIGQQAGIIPNLDSITEFRILSSNVDAEYGGFTGGIINVVTKSGTVTFMVRYSSSFAIQIWTHEDISTLLVAHSIKTSLGARSAGLFARTKSSSSPITKDNRRFRESKRDL